MQWLRRETGPSAGQWRRGGVVWRSGCSGRGQSGFKVGRVPVGLLPTRGYQMREEDKTREWIMNQYSDERTQETKCQLRHQQEHLNKHEGGRPAADNQSIGGENRTAPASQH